MSAAVSHAPRDPFLGDPSVIAQDRLGEIKSNLFRHRRRYVVQRWGTRGLDQICERVRPEAVAYLREPPILSKWLDHHLMIDVDRVITEELMGGDVSQMRAFGASNGTADFEQVYAHLVTMFTGPHFLLKRTGSLFAMQFRNKWTEMTTTRSTPQEVRIEMRGNGMYRYMCRFGVVGWLESVLALYQVRTEALGHILCMHDGDDRCAWTLRWS